MKLNKINFYHILSECKTIFFLNLRPYSQRLVFFITYEWAQKAKLFVPGKPFQPNLMCHSCLLGPYTHYATQYICIYSLHTLTHFPNALHIHIQIHTLFTLHVHTYTHTHAHTHYTLYKQRLHTLHTFQTHYTAYKYSFHTLHALYACSLVIKFTYTDALYWCVFSLMGFVNIYPVL
jgi:hypothetical protein